jgi:alcohol dehydrogenase class IV
MKKMIFTKTALVAGTGALHFLAGIVYKKAVIVTGGGSMIRTGVIGRIQSIMKKEGCEIALYSGIGKNPTTAEVLKGAEFLRNESPDVVLAVGGGSAIDAAKIMVLFYEYPELSFDNVLDTPLDDKKLATLFIAIPSTSGTASEVTHVSVITFEEKELKLAVRSEHIRPDIAILDGTLPATMPQNIAAETGMDALTHALEAYVNKTGNDFTDALAKEAIEGLMEWLPVSCGEGTLISREKVHSFQCMAGMAFSNSGLGMVHGVSHAFGGKYNIARRLYHRHRHTGGNLSKRF